MSANWDKAQGFAFVLPNSVFRHSPAIDKEIADAEKAAKKKAPSQEEQEDAEIRLWLEVYVNDIAELIEHSNTPYLDILEMAYDDIKQFLKAQKK